MKTRIGVNSLAYPEFRNLVSLPLRNYEFVRSPDIFTILSFVRRRFRRPPGATSLYNTFHLDLGINRVKLFHFFNHISALGDPWIVTFEHYLPRWNVHSRIGLRLLAGKACKKIIAISRFASDHQRYFLRLHPDFMGDILSKMCLIHPAQPPLIKEYAEKGLDSEFLTFTFVGVDFFRKGGREILHVFDRLVRERYPVKLRLISSLHYGDYASRTTEEDRREAGAIIDRLKSNVTYYPKPANEDVLRLLVNSHVGLLPTFDDTYGYSVLESQAAGSPVITTDVCALPEINNEQCGWVIRLPRDEFGVARRYTKEERREI